MGSASPIGQFNGKFGGRSLKSVGWAVVVGWGATLALAQKSSRQDPIQSVRAVRALTFEKAAQSLPVKLHARVTLYDPSIRTLFIQDKTGGVYVHMGTVPPLPLHEGTEVEVDGVTAPGDFAPIVLQPTVHILRQSKGHPTPARISTEMLKTGVYDSQWVQMVGVVHSVKQIGRRVSLLFKTLDGPVEAISVGGSEAEYERLIGSRIRIQGVAGAYYNKRHQLTGVHLFFGDWPDLQVIRSAGGDGFGIPLRKISQLAQFDQNASPMERVHIRGRATLVWPGVVICIQEEAAGICTQYTSKEKFDVGMLVDAVGFPEFAAPQPGVEDVVLRQAPGPIEPPGPRVLDLPSAMTGDGAGTLVTLEGEFVGAKANGHSHELLFRSAGMVFSAVTPALSPENQSLNIETGSKVRITGVDIAEIDAHQHGGWTSEQHVTSIRLLTRSMDDIKVLQTPSWWSTAHLLYVACSGSLATLIILVWAGLLRRQVSQRTRELKASEARYRLLAHHDVLTGAPNRAFFYERASAMLERAQQTSRRFAVMLVDLDRFKPINDSLGHEAGDKVLCAVVQRANGALDANDFFARLGGDEFAVLMECTKDDSLMKKAQTLMTSICQPLALDGGERAISASLGIAIFPTDGRTIRELLSKADAAMYRSKLKGKGGVERFGQILTTSEADEPYLKVMEEVPHPV